MGGRWDTAVMICVCVCALFYFIFICFGGKNLGGGLKFHTLLSFYVNCFQYCDFLCPFVKSLCPTICLVCFPVVQKVGKYSIALKQYDVVVKILDGYFNKEEKKRRDPLKLAGHLNLAACQLKLQNNFKCVRECQKVHM